MTEEDWEEALRKEEEERIRQEALSLENLQKKLHDYFDILGVGTVASYSAAYFTLFIFYPDIINDLKLSSSIYLLCDMIAQLYTCQAINKTKTIRSEDTIPFRKNLITSFCIATSNTLVWNYTLGIFINNHCHFLGPLGSTVCKLTTTIGSLFFSPSKRGRYEAGEQMTTRITKIKWAYTMVMLLSAGWSAFENAHTDEIDLTHTFQP